MIIDPFDIPEEWRRAFALAVQPSGVAALWGARDPSGTIYLYAEHQPANAEPSENARAIRRCGQWVPGIVSSASVPGSQAARNGIAALYGQHGLTIDLISESERASGYERSQMLASKQLKVFASLSAFQSAYRIGDPEALLLQCCDALIAGREYMKSKPKPRSAEYYGLPLGPNSWMAA